MNDKAMRLLGVPQELRELPRWLLWRLEERPGQPKPAKVPYQADGRPASATDPAGRKPTTCTINRSSFRCPTCCPKLKVRCAY